MPQCRLCAVSTKLSTSTTTGRILYFAPIRPQSSPVGTTSVYDNRHVCSLISSPLITLFYTNSSNITTTGDEDCDLL